MQVGIRTPIAVVSRTSESNAATSIPLALKMMLERIAHSTRLNLAQKRSFADAIKNAFETGNGKLMVKIMMAVAQAEAQVAEGKHAAHSIEDILNSAQTDSNTHTPDTTYPLSGQDRLRQLLFS